MDYKYLILVTVANCLWALGVWNAFGPDQIFGEVGEFLAGNSKANPPIEPHAPEWLTKPLFDCLCCMSSFHGVLFWLFFRPVPLILLPVYVVCLSGLLKIIVILVVNRDTE